MSDVCERSDLTLLDTILSIVIFVELPILFLGFALLNTTHVLNRTSSKAVDKMLYEILIKS